MHMTAPIFKCRIYDSRPTCCKNYPWADAQLLFDNCQFVHGGQVTALEMVVTREKDVADYCLKCGRCCYVWSKSGDDLSPVAVCRNLEVTHTQSICFADQQAMISTTDKYDFN